MPSAMQSGASVDNGSSVTVWDASGFAFTLDIDRKEIRGQDGVIIGLTAAETAQAASAFLTIVAGDRITAAIESTPPPEDECPPDEPTCLDPMASAFEGPSTSTVVIRLVNSRAGVGEGGRFGSRLVRRAPTRRLPKRTSRESGVQTMSTRDWPSNCLDIANAIYEAMPAYDDTRKVYLNVLKELWPFFSFENGAPRTSLNEYPEIAMALGTAFYRLQAAELQLNIMAGIYSASGCWNNTWQDAGGPGSTTNTEGSIGGGAYDMDCRIETWEISYDGGLTWYFYADVAVCEFKENT